MLEVMGNTSSHSPLPRQGADRKTPLASQTVDRADVVTDDEVCPGTSIPQNSLCSRILVRNGEKLACGNPL